MALIAKLYSDDRAADRHALEIDGTVRATANGPVDVMVSDLSTTGCYFQTAEALDAGEIITIGLAGVGRREASVVRALQYGCGCEFVVPLSANELRDALATPADVVVAFPSGADRASPDEAVTPVGGDTYPGFAKVSILIGGGVGAWALVAATVSWLM